MRKIVICGLMLLGCVNLARAEVLTNGFLQAYWLPNWNQQATVNTPSLEFRYIYLEQDKAKVIDLDLDGDEKQQIEFIKQHFQQIPQHFLQYKEWYVNQSGSVEIANLTSYSECDSQFYRADLIAFTANDNQAVINKLAGCGISAPYSIDYVLADGIQQAALKQQPNENTPDVAQINPQTTLIQLQTVDENWLLVAVYDADAPDFIGKQQGYIQKNGCKCLTKSSLM